MNPTTPIGLFATAAAAHVLAVMSPGPDFAVVTRQTLAHGRAAGLATAWGIASGIIFHVAYALFGLGWVLAQWPWLVDLLRYAGAAFLIWLGCKAIAAQPTSPTAVAAPMLPAARRDFWVGLATNLLNPKATLFFVALCSALLTTPTPVSLRLALAGWIVLSTGAWFSLVALMLGHPRARQKLASHAHWIDRGMGALLLLLGLAMLLAPLLH